MQSGTVADARPRSRFPAPHKDSRKAIDCDKTCFVTILTSALPRYIPHQPTIGRLVRSTGTGRELARMLQPVVGFQVPHWLPPTNLQKHGPLHSKSGEDTSALRGIPTCGLGSSHFFCGIVRVNKYTALVPSPLLHQLNFTWTHPYHYCFSFKIPISIIYNHGFSS